MYEELVAPVTFIPLTTHRYAGGVPPFMGVAEKVTKVPAHTGFAEREIDMLTGKSGFTAIIMVLEVAGLPVAHTALDFKTQAIISLFTGALEYEALVAPGTFVPLTFH